MRLKSNFFKREMLQRNTQIFACGIGGTLVLIFILELAQMNINKWGDSWGAGCVIGAIGFTLRKCHYFLSKISNQNAVFSSALVFIRKTSTKDIK